LKLGDAAHDDTLTISNTGALPVDFNLKRVNKPFPHTPAFAIAYPNENLVYIPDTLTPNNWTIICSVDDPIEERDFIAGDFVGGDFSTLYLMDAYSDTLFVLNTTTAAYMEIGLATAEGDWTGLTGTPEGVLYGISTNCNTFTNLYTLTTDSAAATNLGALAGIRCGNDLAYNPDDGLIYIIDTFSYHLFKVDPATLVVTVVGPLGMNM
jgi:DNA-binding beta-propeller fold protein YncE